MAKIEKMFGAILKDQEQKSDELRDKIKLSLDKARASLEDTKESLQERGEAAVTAAEDYVQSNPWQSVGIAAGVGFLIGLLATRR